MLALVPVLGLCGVVLGATIAAGLLDCADVLLDIEEAGRFFLYETQTSDVICDGENGRFGILAAASIDGAAKD